MKLNPSLSKLLFLPVLVILFSLGFFSFKSSAKELITSETLLFTRNDGLQSEIRIRPDSYSSDVFYGFYINGNNSRSILFFSESNFVVQRRQGKPISPNESWSSYGSTYVPTYGGIYVYQSDFTTFSLGSGPFDYDIENFVDSYGNNIYDTKNELLNSDVFVPESFANFGLNNFQYIIYTNQNTFIPNDIYQLSYYITWSGSTTSDYPLTSVRYQLYGFNSIDMDNSDKSNGTLIEDGSCTSPFDYDVYSKVSNLVGTSNYQKFIIYLIPYSGLTEGNTSFIVCNVYTGAANFNFGPLEVPIGGFTGLEASYGSGIIPVDPTDVINTTPVNYIGEVPVMGITQTVSGTFNTNYNTYNHNINYNPIVYDTTNNINNYYDQSSHITNNDNSTIIINNFTGKFDTSNDDASISGIVSFLTAIVTFFNTFWSYVIVGLNFLPNWCIVCVTTLFSTVASVIIALGIFKLFRG